MSEIRTSIRLPAYDRLGEKQTQTATFALG